VARFDSLRREIGLLPPLQKFYDASTLLADIQRSGRDSPMAKALTGLQKRMTATTQKNRAAIRRQAEDPRVAHRAKLASVQKRFDAEIKAGNLTAHEAAVLEVHLHDYAARNC
jgi:hypothetical protein